ALDCALQRQAAGRRALPRRALRHRLRQAGSPCHSEGRPLLLRVLRRALGRADRAARAGRGALPGDRLRLRPHARRGIGERQPPQRRVRALPAARGDTGRGLVMASEAAAIQPAHPKAWLIFAFATTILWGIWGAFIDLPTQRGFPETLVYCVWSLTMIPPSLYALSRTGWRLDWDARAITYGLIIGLLGAGGQLVLFRALTTGPAYL